MMHGGPSATDTKRSVLRVLLLEGRQTAKLVVDPGKLGAEHGFPVRVMSAYPDGIPLDLNPAWPLDLDLEDDPVGLWVSLSFGGQVCRCRVPWRAISMIAVGVGGVAWQHEREDVASRPPSRLPPRRVEPAAQASHLRVLK
jgi:hypothetical protein